MNYMFLIFGDESKGPAPGSAEFGELIGAYHVFEEEIKSAGVFVCGEALESVTTATTVSVRDGKTNYTDGPFAETKEQLGGFYVLNCKDLDEALGYAAKIPSAQDGHVEVRPVMEIPD